MQALLDEPTTVTLNDPDFLRRVNELRRTDNVTNWFYLLREYAFLAIVIGGTIASYYWLMNHGLSLAWSIPLTVIAILCVGAGQHRLATLTHEAAHYMLFRNRLLNELVSEICCMYPILGLTHSYRVQHLGHHQYPNDDVRDPDWAQMSRSGHRFVFPMSQERFLWSCVLKQVLWPPNLIRYVLVRAFFKVQGERGTPYHLKRRAHKALMLFSIAYMATLVASLAYFTWQPMTTALAVVPLLLLAGALAFFRFVPAQWYSEYAIKSDLSSRAQACLRVSVTSIMFTAIAWATVLTGMPWWFYYALLWLTPLATSFSLFMILRQIVQHGNADQERFTNTRIFHVHPLISMAVFPIGNDYHLPHHLFPMVPHYNLRKLHALLLEAEAYREQATLVEGYFLPPERPAKHPTVVDLMTR